MSKTVVPLLGFDVDEFTLAVVRRTCILGVIFQDLEALDVDKGHRMLEGV